MASDLLSSHSNGFDAVVIGTGVIGTGVIGTGVIAFDMRHERHRGI